MEDNQILEPTEQVQTPEAVADYQVSSKKGSSMRVAGLVGIFALILLAGVGSGYGLSRIFPSASSGQATELSGAPGTLEASQVEVGKIYGIEDAEKFKDTSEGIVVKGGIDGEGSHHLIRAGGKSQTVYMTSSVVDLDLFIDAKVQVKGETFSAQKAAWFMDVGSVKVLELNAQKPAGSEEVVPAE